MSVIIKGMEMPEYCSACPCETDNVCEAATTHLTYHEWTEHRPSWCPLVYVPDTPIGQIAAGTIPAVELDMKTFI